MLNDIVAGDIYQDENGDKWKVVGRILSDETHKETRIACFDEPIDDAENLPYVTPFTLEQISRMTLWDKDDEEPEFA